MDNIKKIDIAAHIGYDPLQEIGTSIEDLIGEMDEQQVERAVLHPMGAGFINEFKVQNRELASLCGKDGRFYFFSTVNPWFGQEAEEELAFSFDSLGAAGVSFHTARQGCYIDSPMIEPFIRIARERAKPVYFFTGFPVYSLPLNLAHLAVKFPDVTFIMGAMGVSDYWADIIPSFRLAPNMYLETSVNTNVPAVLGSFIDEFGDKQILFATNYPFTDYNMETAKIARAGLAEESLNNIYFRNAAELLGIER